MAGDHGNGGGGERENGGVEIAAAIPRFLDLCAFATLRHCVEFSSLARYAGAP